MIHKIIIACCFSSMLVSSCSFFSVNNELDDFIRVQRVHFVHNGKPYYFAGANLWYGCYLGSSGITGDRTRLIHELDTLQKYGITNLRLLAASEKSNIHRSITPAIQCAPGVVDDSLLQGLDFVLSEMAKRHMHAVLFLNNYWEWSGGMSQYMAWVTGKEGPDPELSEKGYGGFMDYSAEFYSATEAMQLYREYVKRIITRENSINGRRYSEDPTIMSWQLANEPRPGWGELGSTAITNLPSFYTWIDQSARYIHSLDTNHLVSTGSEGTAGTLWSDEYYLEAHKGAAVDYLTMHVWPLNWGWFDPNQIEKTLPTAKIKVLDYISHHLMLARRLNKPIVMDEFGMARDSGQIRIGTTVTTRDQYFGLLYAMVYDSARAGAPISGSNFWTWSGEGTAQHDDGVWREHDSFTGDPPQEPQGRNSVFAADKSTIEIISGHAKKMQRLGIADSIYFGSQ